MSSVRPNVSIVIKALNEERHIAVAIESAMAALESMRGEVMRGEIMGEIILADSASTDRTVEIAANYPIKIVTLRNPATVPAVPASSSPISTARAILSV